MATIRIARIFLVAIFIMTSACASSGIGSAAGPMQRDRAVGVDTVADTRSASGRPLRPERALRRSADLGIAVADPEAAGARALGIVERENGYVEQSSASDDRIDLRVRVPSTRLDATMDALAALGEVETRSTSADDVTDLLVDLGAALSSKRALRERLRQLLERANTVEEVLDVERELVRLQTEIEQLEARLESLERDVAMSRLSLRLHRPTPRPLPGPGGILLKLACDTLTWFFREPETIF